MGNEKYLALLKQGVTIWNQWRKEHPDKRPELREVDLSIADLSEINFSGTDLRGANLSRAYLIGANISQANLSWTSLNGADLSRADLRKANLSRTDLRKANLSEANLSGVDFSEASLSEANLSKANLKRAGLIGTNLQKVNLSKANLSEADLFEANLNEADLSEADLSWAYLVEVQALKTNFYRAVLTGVCLENWEYDHTTNLNEVICDYVYLKEHKKERFPQNLGQNFAPGEFSQHFHKVLGVIEFVFKDEIDWQVFLASFQQLQAENVNTQLLLQAIENKSEKNLVIRVEISHHAEIVRIKESFWQKYTLLLEAKDLQIGFAHQEIAIKRQENLKLSKILEKMAEQDSLIPF